MDKNAIRKYAVWARTELIERVTQKAQQYGISEGEIIDANADSINGKLLSATEKKQRQALIAKIKEEGFEQVMEEVAYTWFNRFTALRFMEVNNYLPSHTRVFTNEANEFKPQILADAISLEIDGLDMDKVFELKNANKDENLYKYLIIVQCNSLSSVLPRMFQKISDFTELLFPDNLLRDGSVIYQMIEWIPEEDWKDAVQIIGWLYQFYNTEPKAKVFSKNGKITKEEIPAATQLFTPDWIVRYMVENSLGRLWINGHPNDELKSSWNYYLDEAKQEENVQAKLLTVKNEHASILPEQIKCIDPCSGSGHILAYMFDVLMEIYESYGYTTREAVRSIIENNLYGLDIDERAAQLAYFSVMMKARQYDRRFLIRKNEEDNADVPQPHIYVIVESNDIDSYTLEYFTNGDSNLDAAISSIIREMHNAKEYGSILNVTPVDFKLLYARFNEINNDINISRENALRELLPLVQVAENMATKYEVVVTNPPYMGSGSMGNKLSDYIKKMYPDSKNDLYSVFIERCHYFTKKGGYQGMITQHSWMFLSRFEKLRKKMQLVDTVNMAHLGPRAFEEIGGEVVQTTAFVKRNTNINGYIGTYCRLLNAPSQDKKEQMFLSGANRFYSSQDIFENIYGSPVAYWISQNMMRDFTEKELGDYGSTRQGFATGDNGRFLRFWHEIDMDKLCFGCVSVEDFWKKGGKYVPCNKGGETRKWYGNNYMVCKFDQESYAALLEMGNHLPSRDYYFKKGLTWSTLGNFLSMRYSSEGFVFETKGSMYFAFNEDNTKYLLGVMNSKVAMVALQVLCPTIDFHEGPVSHVPIIITDKKEIESLVDENISISKEDWDSYEISWDFKEHPLIRGKSISEAYKSWQETCEKRFTRLKKNEEEINQRLIAGYGLEDEVLPLVDDKEVTINKADLVRDIKGFISYAVGCMFGRYSLDVPGIVYAGGEWDTSKYITFHADRDGIIPICDDEYFIDDIVGRFVQFVEVLYGKDTLEENLRFISYALGGNGQPREIIRKYFVADFYNDHVKMYQKCPIYWMFDSGKKGGFKALVYIHRYQSDTIARIRTDYVHEQQARYRNAITDLEQRMNSASTSERVKLNKRLKIIQEQSVEIQLYEEKVHHLADQYIQLNLDDGVKYNYGLLQDILQKIK